MSCQRCHRDVAPEATYCPACGAPQSDANGSAWSRRRLTRLSAEQKIAGVCGGLAEYFGIDATPVRVLWIVLSVLPGAVIGGVLAYVVAWIIVPKAPMVVSQQQPHAA